MSLSKKRTKFRKRDVLIGETPNTPTDNKIWTAENKEITPTVFKKSVGGYIIVSLWFLFHCNSLSDIYFTGTEDEWMEILKNNIPSTATIHYNYVPEGV